MLISDFREQEASEVWRGTTSCAMSLLILHECR